MAAATLILQEIKGLSEFWANRKADPERDPGLHKSFSDTNVKQIAKAKKFDKNAAVAKLFRQTS